MGHRSVSSYDLYICTIPGRSNVHVSAPSGASGKESDEHGVRLVVIHCAPSKVNPAPTSESTRNFLVGTGMAIVRQCSIVSRGWSPASHHTSPGTVSSTHTCTGRGSRLPNWCTMDIATLPPNECPIREWG